MADDDVYDETPQEQPDCLCASGAADRECMIAVIDSIMGPAGQYTSVQKLIPGWTSINNATSCGDVVGAIVHRWGSSANCYFMVDDPQKADGTAMPEPGDIFVLKSVATGQRAHIGFFYEVSGTPDNIQWRAAEGGQGPRDNQVMWISDQWRSMNDGEKVLDGWKSLADLSRDRLVCKKYNKR
jgi:hypothetical protein